MDLGELHKKKEKLEKELKKVKADIEKQASSLSGLNDINDISDEAKIDAFNNLYALCLENVEHVVERGYELKDISHWIYEMAIESTLGKKAWKIINQSDSPY